MHGVQRPRLRRAVQAARAGHGATNAVDMSRVQRRGRGDQREGPLQAVQRQEDRAREEEPRGARRQGHARQSEDYVPRREQPRGE